MTFPISDVVPGDYLVGVQVDGADSPLERDADPDRPRYINPKVTIDASHPYYAIDHNRCIMCVRCVRVCGEIEGAHTWGVMGSGIDERVVTDMGTPWGESTTCTSCGRPPSRSTSTPPTW